jgi:predicted AAA+ superfamily ATPase
MLVDTLIGFRLLAFEGKLRVREKKKSKFYFIDSGLVRSLRRDFGNIRTEEKSYLYEGFIA